MAFRNQNRNRNFGGSNYGGQMGGSNPNRGNMNTSPWEVPNTAASFGAGGGNMRQGQGMNAQAINLANNLLNNLFRNQNPPSLLDLPRGGNMGGNRGHRGMPMVNRGGTGPGNRLNNRRSQGGFQNRNGGSKATQKPSTSGGIRKQNAFDRAKKLLAKNANKKKDSGDKKTESKEQSPYDSVPNDMFYCHLCKKHMWDSNSFENHIKGRTHLMMREGIEESYRLKANMIRQEAKIAEQLKSIELDRLKRMGKSKQRQLDYCTMCDLNFHGHISAHRKSDGHLQLKKFLHPKCNECSKEFATRIDYDTHLLSAEHLKRAAEKNTKVGERKRQTLLILTEEEELKDVRPPQKKKKKAQTAKNSAADGASAVHGANHIKKEPEDGAAEGGEEADVEDMDKKYGEEDADEANEAKYDDMNESCLHEEEETSVPVDAQDCILDYKDGDEIPVEVDNRLPKYNWNRPVGANLITKLECYECSLCAKFFDTEKTVEVHSRTVGHHRNFLKFINEKSSDTKIAQKRAAAALQESERKRRKMEEAENSVNGEAANTDHDMMDGQEGGDEGEGRTVGRDDLYDPSEATGDDFEGDLADEDDYADDDNNGLQIAMDPMEEDEKKADVIPEKANMEQRCDSVAASRQPEVQVKTEAAVSINEPVVQSAAANENQASLSAANPATSASAPVAAIHPSVGQIKSAAAAAAAADTLTPPAGSAISHSATPNANDATPNKKMNPGGGRGGNAKTPGTPRGRGRGRYNRY